MFRLKSKVFVCSLILGFVLSLAAPVLASTADATIQDQNTAQEANHKTQVSTVSEPQQELSSGNYLNSAAVNPDGTPQKPLSSSLIYEVEPNDTLSSATPITLGAFVAGFFSSTYDHDYYSIYVPQDSDIILEGQASQDNLSDYFCLFVKNSAGTMIGYTDNVIFTDGTHGQLLKIHLQRGTYYIHAQTYDNSTDTYSTKMSGENYQLVMLVNPASTVSVSSVTLDKTSVTIAPGSTAQLSAAILPSNATDTTLTWSSSNPSIATVNSTGLVTGVASGTAYVTATASNGIASPTCAVTVTPVCDLAPYKPSGWGAPLVVTKTLGQLYTDTSLTPDDGLYINFAYANNGPDSTPSTPISTLLYLDNNYLDTRIHQGVIQANWNTSIQNLSIGKLSAGSHTIKMVIDTTNAVNETNENNNDYSVTVNVSSSVIQPTSVSLNKSSTSLATGTTEQLLATFLPSNTSNQTLTWSSGNPAIASVSSNGLVTGIAAGTTYVMATASNGVASSPCLVTVTLAQIPVTTVTLNNTSVTITKGSTAQLSATVSPANATNTTLIWSSSYPGIATVSSSGLVTGIAAGTTSVSATASNGVQSGNCTVTITDAQAPPPSGATIPTGTVIFDRPILSPDIALSFAYCNAAANLAEVRGYILENPKMYVKDFTGKFIDNSTGKEVAKSVIPAVQYKDEKGNTYTVSAGDGSTSSATNLMATVRDVTWGSILNISLSASAKSLFPTAVQYQCYDTDGTTAITALKPLGTDTTVFPKMTVGDSVIVKLYTADGIQVGENQIATLTNSETLLTATIQSVSIGSALKVSLTDEGKTQYPTAAQFQVYSSDGSEPVSACSDLDTTTSVYPAQAAGDSVIIKLYTSVGTQVGEGITATLVSAN